MAGLQADDAIPAALAEHNQELFSEKKLATESASEVGDNHSLASDDPHHGDVFPTTEERESLRRIPDTIPWATYLIAFVELAERFSYYGATVVFTNFIQQPLPPNSRAGAGGKDGQSGALGLGQRASTGLGTFNTFWVYVTPLFGAYIADTYLGRYNTVCIAVAIAIVGHILLVVSSIPSVMEHSHGALACFIIAIIIMGAGTGGFKSNISPLVAEQYRKSRLFIREKKSGERVIVDPTLTASRIYMYFYLFINIGALIGQIGMTYSEKYVGFWLAYTLPTLVFLSAPVVLWIGYSRYYKSPPAGSVLPGSIRIWRAAAAPHWSWNPIATWRNMHRAGFWDAVKPSNYKARGEALPRWMTFDDQWVDEVRRGFKACAVFVWFPIYWLSYNQINNNLTSQAATMTTNGLPNDVLSNLDPFALVILIPICDQFIYPAMRRYGFNFTPIKKITWGFYTGAAAMAWAAVVQHYIYKRSPCGYKASTCTDADGNALPSDLNVWIQTGSYVLIAISEILASITGLEYAFTEAPKNMRPLIMAIFLFMSAIAAAIGEAFVSLSADPLLVWNYATMGVLALVAGIGFWWTFRDLDAEEDELNALATGHLDAGAVEQHRQGKL